MTEKLNYCIFNTSAGWVGVLGSTAGLRSLILPQRTSGKVRELFGDGLNATESASLFEDLIQRLKAYFNGRRVAFPDKLDFSGASAFQRKVWEATRLIPYGETRSYSWIAKQIRQPKAARAVGQALGQNPLPVIVPCHRVLASDGKLGGYSGGLEMKRYLLRLESGQA